MKKILGIVCLVLIVFLARDFMKVEEVSSRIVDLSNPNLILVNKNNPLEKDYNKNKLVCVNVNFVKSSTNEEKLMQDEAATALENLFKAAKINGIILYGNSGYRSSETQKVIYDKIKKNKGEEYAKSYVSKPLESEHQTGLVMDVTNKERNFFEGSREAKWVKKNAHKYGFIIRYPKGKESITGYPYEPWHIRYVGLQASREIYNKDITLEEYIKGSI